MKENLDDLTDKFNFNELDSLRTDFEEHVGYWEGMDNLSETVDNTTEKVDKCTRRLDVTYEFIEQTQIDLTALRRRMVKQDEVLQDMQRNMRLLHETVMKLAS